MQVDVVNDMALLCVPRHPVVRDNGTRATLPRVSHGTILERTVVQGSVLKYTQQSIASGYF